MECPNCSNNNILEMHTDVIICDDCGSDINIKYCFCEECNYSFRVQKDKVLDGNSMADFDDTLTQLAEVLESEESFDLENYSMCDLLNPCVRCGRVSTTFNSKTNEFECVMCGFKWEILKNE